MSLAYFSNYSTSSEDVYIWDPRSWKKLADMTPCQVTMLADLSHWNLTSDAASLWHHNLNTNLWNGSLGAQLEYSAVVTKIIVNRSPYNSKSFRLSFYIDPNIHIPTIPFTLLPNTKQVLRVAWFFPLCEVGHIYDPICESGLNF